MVTQISTKVPSPPDNYISESPCRCTRYGTSAVIGNDGCCRRLSANVVTGCHVSYGGPERTAGRDGPHEGRCTGPIVSDGVTSRAMGGALGPGHRESSSGGMAMVKGQLLTIDEMAERLNVSVRFVRRLVDERRVPYLKIGKFIRFAEDDLETWMQAQRIETLR